ncbi:MAG: M20/M25/M40 family metallo-hydrolase [Thermoplasmata archaeon]|nr:M20/M25/M40 family metallo-hydrolase [Thermoplasmata archaeon]MCI4359473.1 M20/M25/M40 family metallo-hydrolase [Thermoplasmata archaeon]
MGERSSSEEGATAAEAIGDRSGLEMLQSLVAIAPTNLEDPLSDRYEKPNYRRAADEIVRWARRFGLSTRHFDPTVDLPPDPIYRGVPRPNLIIDLEAGTSDRLLILAHFDVVPVPQEQLGHWKTPPFSLSRRADGRLYGRGANDDLGSGLVASLLAMKRLADSGDAPRSVRLLACCDEETGGLGGIEAIKEHDRRLPMGDPGRFLDGSAALIPDGSPHATAASSGLIFLDGTFETPATPGEIVRFGNALLGLDALARAHRSAYSSPDWPDHLAPESVITGRATLTRFDLQEGDRAGGGFALVSAHAENDAPNQIAAAVTLGFAGPPEGWEGLIERMREALPVPFRLESPATSTALAIAPEVRTVQILGRSAHGGYPHRGANPVPAALSLIDRLLESRSISVTSRGRASFAVDLRLIPEMPLEPERQQTLDRLNRWATDQLPSARVDAPRTRARGGYAIPIDHPAVQKLARILRERLGESGVYGEYGGTDASSLSEITTPTGAALPALVFGSMDRESHIHEAEESVDPRLIAQVSATIEQYAREA